MLSAGWVVGDREHLVRAGWGTGARCRCLHACSIEREVLPFSVCPADRFLVLTKEKTQTNPQNNVLSLFMAVSTAPFFSLVLLPETPCFRASLDLFQFSRSQFKPLRFPWARWGAGLQQPSSPTAAGREDPWGLQKAQGSSAVLGTVFHEQPTRHKRCSRHRQS